MEWIDVNDIDVKTPYTKVCIWDGGNTFWAYLQKLKKLIPKKNCIGILLYLKVMVCVFHYTDENN
jgi:hypothetical protein